MTKEDKPMSSVIFRCVLALIVTYIVLAPASTFLPNVLSFGYYNEKRFIQIMLLVFLGLVLWLSHTDQINVASAFFSLPIVIRRLLIAVAALGMISSLLSKIPTVAFFELSLFVSLFGLSLACSAIVREWPAQTKLATVIAVAVLAAAYDAEVISQYCVAINTSSNWLFRDLIGGFSNPRFLNQIQSWVLPFLALSLTIRRVRPFVLIVPMWLVGSLFWMTVFVSEGRGTPVALGLASIFVCLSFGQQTFRWLLRQFSMALTGFVLYIVAWMQTSGKVSLAIRTSSSGRLELWQSAITLIREDPLLGAGPGHYITNLMSQHPHNALLQWAAEWGLVSTVIVVFIVLWGYIQWVRQSKQIAKHSKDNEIELRIALTVSLTAAGIHAMLSGIIVMPLSQLLGALIIGMSLGIYHTEQKMETTPSTAVSLQPSLRYRVGILVTVGVILIGGLSTWMGAMELRKTIRGSSTSALLYPRIWLPGNFQDFEAQPKKGR
jgi:O-antigen ligase